MNLLFGILFFAVGAHAGDPLPPIPKAMKIVSFCKGIPQAECEKKVATFAFHYPPLDASNYYQLMRSACGRQVSVACGLLAIGLQSTQVAGDEDYKTIFTVEALHQSEAKCRAGSAVDCLLVSRANYRSLFEPRDDGKASQLHEIGCRAGDTLSCDSLGADYELGQGRARSYEKAAEIYRQGCDAKEWISCGSLAGMYRRGLGVKQSYQKAAELDGLACHHGYADGCVLLGNLYRNGHGVPVDQARTFEYYTAACLLDSGIGCANLGAAYAKGMGTKKSLVDAENWLTRACEIGYAGGCRNLGAMYSGDGLSLNFDKATELYRHACDLDDGMACVFLGQNVAASKGKLGDASIALGLYQKACALDEPKGCCEVSRAYSAGLAGIKADVNAAMRARELAFKLDPKEDCAAGNPDRTN